MSSPNATPHDRSRENEPAPDNPLEDALWAALARVEDPELRRPITELGMVEYARVLAEEDDPQRHYAQVKVLLTIEGCPLKNTIDTQVREAAAAVTGIDRVQLELGAMNSEQRGALKSRLKPERTNPFTAPGSLTRIFGVVSGKGEILYDCQSRGGVCFAGSCRRHYRRGCARLLDPRTHGHYGSPHPTG